MESPLVRSETVRKFPEIEVLLKRLAGMIDDETMQRLNYRVDKEKKRPSEVAREFLASKGLLR